MGRGRSNNEDIRILRQSHSPEKETPRSSYCQSKGIVATSKRVAYNIIMNQNKTLCGLIIDMLSIIYTSMMLSIAAQISES